MTPTSTENERDSDGTNADRPTYDRVEVFLASLDQGRATASRTRWLGAGVGVVIGGVALLTALGIVPVTAESVVLSASAAVAAFALGKS